MLSHQMQLVSDVRASSAFYFLPAQLPGMLCSLGNMEMHYGKTTTSTPTTTSTSNINKKLSGDQGAHLNLCMPDERIKTLHFGNRVVPLLTPCWRIHSSLWGVMRQLAGGGSLHFKDDSWFHFSPFLLPQLSLAQRDTVQSVPPPPPFLKTPCCLCYSPASWISVPRLFWYTADWYHLTPRLPSLLSDLHYKVCMKLWRWCSNTEWHIQADMLSMGSGTNHAAAPLVIGYANSSVLWLANKGVG